MTKGRKAVRMAGIICLVLALGCGSAAAEIRTVRILVGDTGVALRSSPEYLGEDNRITGICPGTVLTVLDECGEWYLVRYGTGTGYVFASGGYVTVTDTESVPGTDLLAEEEYDLGMPELGGRVISPGEMNLAVLWVQTQLDAAGYLPAEPQSGLTGLLDDRTVEAVRQFMRTRGVEDHSGWIDREVVLELGMYLGRGLVPVPVGGMYRAMGSIMGQGSTGSMSTVTLSSGGGIPEITVIARWAQVCLRYLGYYTGEITGRFDEKTADALKGFEADQGYGEYAFLTPGTARRMLECYVDAGGELYALP